MSALPRLSTVSVADATLPRPSPPPQRMSNRRLWYYTVEQLDGGRHPRELLLEGSKQWNRPNQFWYVVAYLQLHRRVDDAVEAFEWWREQPMYRPRERHFLKLMSMAGKLERPDVAEGLFDTMLRLNIPPSVASYSALLQSYAEAGDFDRANAVLHELLATGINPDSMTYTGLIRAYAKHGLYRGLLKVLKSMQCPPDMLVYKAVVRAYAKAGLVSKMDRAFRAMLSDGWTPDTACLDAVTRCYAGSDMMDDVERVLGYYKQLGNTVSQAAIRAVARAYIRQSKFYQMGEFAKSLGMKRVSAGNLLWNLVLLSSAANFAMKRLQREAQSMAAGGFKPDLTSFNIRAVAFAKMQMHWDLHVLVRHMQSLDVVPDLVTYGAVVDAYVSARLHHKLSQALDKLQMLEWTPEVSTDILLFDAFGRGAFHLFCEGYMQAGSKLTYSTLTTMYMEETLDYV